MSKIKLLLIIGAASLNCSAFAITNAELARLNNELIGLDARLAVAKKQAELAKYTGAVPVRAVTTLQPDDERPVPKARRAADSLKVAEDKNAPAQSTKRAPR